MTRKMNMPESTNLLATIMLVALALVLTGACGTDKAQKNSKAGVLG
jgi:hypothetical protein